MSWDFVVDRTWQYPNRVAVQGPNGRVARGNCTPGSHRTERDSLPSLRSSHRSPANVAGADTDVRPGHSG